MYETSRKGGTNSSIEMYPTRKGLRTQKQQERVIEQLRHPEAPIPSQAGLKDPRLQRLVRLQHQLPAALRARA